MDIRGKIATAWEKSERRPAERAPDGPGWYAAPGRPGLQTYWDGQQWSPDVAPRPVPASTWSQARPVMLGVVVALVLLALLF